MNINSLSLSLVLVLFTAGQPVADTKQGEECKEQYADKDVQEYKRQADSLIAVNDSLNIQKHLNWILLERQQNRTDNTP